MTREEAIKRIEDHMVHHHMGEYPHVFIGEALAMAIAALREQPRWISVEERLPTVDEEDNGLVGIVNGYNGRITFTDAVIFLRYDFDEKVWWSEDYSLEGCKVTHWMPLPEPPKEEV